MCQLNICSGHLDSRSSIRYVLFATSLLSLAFSISQGALEVFTPDDSFRIHNKDFNLFGHGGMLFWFASSIVFSIVSIFFSFKYFVHLFEQDWKQGYSFHYCLNLNYEFQR